MSATENLNVDMIENEGKTKGMRLSPSTRTMYDQMKAAAGGTDDAFIASLLQLSKLKDLQETEPGFAAELKELQKYLNRISSSFIRVMERGSDSLTEQKKESQDELQRLERVITSLKDEKNAQQKKLSIKDQELMELNEECDELRSKMVQYEKTIQAIEELNKLTNENNSKLQARVEELIDAEQKVIELKQQMHDLKENYDREIVNLKEVEKELRVRIEGISSEAKRDKEELIQRYNDLQKEHKRNIEHIKKETEMEAREKIFKEKLELQKAMDQLRERHSETIEELLRKMQEKNDK
ncbi:hypothetical protein [Paenibacillus glucanolyticus]|uniref:hypothetical protein n=1 Tax=Paenibacillus glucanolyticus TaxID=59843 RepID=UPI00096DFDF4|nr:hypothetical protein [Paenibacillus glucanolyticus]OMF64421.1 hypothetical protein BK142_31890 [Paenibacillus glucanolyticus]